MAFINLKLRFFRGRFIVLGSISKIFTRVLEFKSYAG